MKIVVPFLLVLIFVFVSCGKIKSAKEPSDVFIDKDGILTVNNLTQDRNISEYEKGRDFWCRTRKTGKFGNENDILEGEKKVRDFIWQYWTEKKRGYIILSCPGTDTQHTSHYFIEPDEKDAWKITEKSFHKSSDDKFSMGESIFYTLERVENKEKREWHLILKSIDGDSDRTIPFYR